MHTKTLLKLASSALVMLVFNPVQADLYRYTMSGQFNFDYGDPYSLEEEVISVYDPQTGEDIEDHAYYVSYGSDANLGEFTLTFTLDDSIAADNSAATRFPNAITDMEISLERTYSSERTISFNPLTAHQFNNPSNDRLYISAESFFGGGDISGAHPSLTVNNDSGYPANLPLSSASVTLQDYGNSLLSDTYSGLVAFEDEFSQSGDWALITLDWDYFHPYETNVSIRTEAAITSIQRTAVVPLPAAVWLFASGLMGLIGLSRHKKIYN
ncbi:MAG: VPLPA-CTERM sorting domain-containing protein [Gammaproteobacteria bacterium]